MTAAIHFPLQRMISAINKLSKWKMFFVSWQLGTRSDKDPECAAIKRHLELSIILRAEVSAIVTLLMQKGIITETEWHEAVAKEAETLDRAYEESYPGFKTSQIGLEMDLPKAQETMKRMNFRP